ncbi:MAG: ribonuclease III family protein [Betaproteobacteria bacterium AqS2]|uniref:Ribonuclease III family protein n=1 Tax=Candidatus Amphirhobacter heronislandensis TaxID=1732024 RepID=A0A930UH97_9GAMM|nr:ribonuclease III family protein [Betaproteobacteria bacterium AqS2]
MGFPHEFADAGLEEACRDRSNPQFQRLEWLGDRALGCAVAQLLYRRHPSRDQADLSRAISLIVSNSNLARVARQLGLVDEQAGLKGAADVLEAYLGAVLEDAGLPAASACVADVFGAQIDNIPSNRVAKDVKTRLNEHLEGEAVLPPEYAYETLRGGFQATCRLGNRVSYGEGASKQAAAREAAARMLAALEAEKKAAAAAAAAEGDAVPAAADDA